MGNTYIKKKQIDGDRLRAEIYNAGFTLHKIAQMVNRSDRQIRYYLKRGEMPEYLLDDIDRAIHPRTKLIWMRIGGYAWVSEDTLYDIMEKCHEEHLLIHGKWAKEDGMEDYDTNESEAQEFLKYFVADGETYIPEVCFDSHLDWWRKKKKEKEG